MIFVTDPDGKASYLSREWTDHTGQTLEEARDYGWAAVVHPDDVETIRRTVAEAVRSQGAFSVRYRLRATDGRFCWVTAGAVPSFGPPGHTFLGFLGSITRAPEAAAQDARAYGSLGRYVPAPLPTPLPDRPAEQPAGTVAESIADHLLLVHAMAAQLDNPRLAALIASALRAVGEELAKAMDAERAAARIH